MISNVDLKLDTLKSHTPTFQSVVVRQGDKASTTLDITITEDNGARPCDLTGLAAKVVAVLANGTYAEADCTVDDATNGRCTYVLDGTFGSVQGYAQDAYVEIRKGDTVIGSTEGFSFYVSVGADISREQAEEYRPFIEQLATRAEDAAESAEQAAQQAKDAQEAAQGALDAVGDATAAANAAAENANAAAQAVRTNILTGTVGPEVVASADDAHPGALMREVQVFGQTRQNLWTNQDTVTRNGVTITNNADGSIALSGTSTGIVTGGADSYALRPGETYTASVNAASTTSTNAAYGSFYVQARAADGSLITGGTHYFGFSTTLSVTFTVPDDAAYCSFGFYCGSSGNTFSGTYRVMLNEGSTAEPWCPPGLSSVSELSVVSAGKNLLGPWEKGTLTNETGLEQNNQDEVRTGFIPVKNGVQYVLNVLKVSGLAKGRAYDSQKNYIGPFNTRASYAGDNVQEFPEGSSFVRYVWTNTESDKFTDMLPDMEGVAQLELGSKSTAYEPPHVTTAPVDLAGHQLRSLPDGTRDVLTWCADGTRSIEQFATEKIYNGDENWVDYQQSGQRPGLFGVNIKNKLVYPQVPFCDSYAVYSSRGGNVTTYLDMMAGIDQNQNVWIRDSRFTTLKDFKANLASNPVTFVALAASSSSIDLAPVPMPEQPSTTLNVWAEADAELTPEVEATYERDLTLAYNDLASKVAALAVAQATN